MTPPTKSTLQRRDVLKGLAVAAAPLFLPSRAFGASDRIGIGLIGCGKIMSGHRNYFIGNERTQVRAVCDVKKWQRDSYRDEVNARYAKKTGTEGYKDCKDYEMFEEMLERDDIDAVVVGTPDHWHVHASIAAMRAGKDVYCEKPLTLTVEEGKAIRKVSEETGKVVQTGSQQRSDQYFRLACELVRNGYAGDIKEIHTRLGSFPPPPKMKEQEIPEGFNYDRWLGQAP
ncbi:MAG: Gfo/Idh/MocA family protein, partial [Verrucomicrobiales bacterium]